MPQNGTQQSGSTSGAGDSGRAQTPEERKGAIDKRLDDSLGTFDGEIRKEQEKNAQERDARNAAAAGAGTADAETTDNTADTKKEGDLASGGTAGTEGPEGKDRQRKPGDLKSDKERKAEGNAGTGSGGGAQGSGAGATEIPDGSDDDVVARRLRKAAEAETDPELKEKLWKEYVEYKKNAK
jgi:hypothetical protein